MVEVMQQLGFIALGAVVMFPIPIFSIVFGTWGVVKLVTILRSK